MVRSNKRGSLTPRGARGGGRGGRGGRGAFRGRGGRAPPDVPYIGASGGFTLADEARQTSQHDHTWTQNSNLRGRPVAFVSAGTIEPLKLLDEFLENTESQKNADPATSIAAVNQDPFVSDHNTSEAVDAEESPTGDKHVDEKKYEYVEETVIGPEELEKSLEAEASVQEDTPFFFDVTGSGPRENHSKTPVPIPERRFSNSSSSSDEVILFKGRDMKRQATPAPDLNLTQMQTEIEVVAQELRVTRSSRPPRSKERKTTSKRHRRQKSSSHEEDPIIADYIANMRESGEADGFLDQLAGNRRDLGGTESDMSVDSDDESIVEKASETEQVVGDDLPCTASNSRPDSQPIAVASAEQKGSDQDDLSGSELDDATLARLIAGHELGADDDVNFGDSSSDSDTSSPPKRETRGPTVDDDFDLMDWNRPSLRRKKGKGARAQISFNVSDSELEHSLQAAWRGDRLKKAERKKQREELRALGMLGKKANPDDMRVKYSQGMSLQEVAEELRRFMTSSAESLSFPPMDPHARKMIHELANKFNIKSKSVGKADQRRTTLYRTVRTLPYVESTFDQAVGRIHRKYFPRLDTKGKRSQRAHPTRTNHSEATYNDGEIVGAAAPELGVENRGRAMLEKMGWSSGTALGAMDNKGILQPVTHAMKRSKAGLG